MIASALALNSDVMQQFMVIMVHVLFSLHVALTVRFTLSSLCCPAVVFLWCVYLHHNSEHFLLVLLVRQRIYNAHPIFPLSALPCYRLTAFTVLCACSVTHGLMLALDLLCYVLIRLHATLRIFPLMWCASRLLALKYCLP